MFHRLQWLARRTARIAGAEPRATLWTLVVLTASLLAVGVAAVAAQNVARWSADAARAQRGGASMVVYLADATGDDQARGIVAQLQDMAGVERAELIGSAETAHRLEQALGADRTALMAGLDTRGLPASIEVTLAPGVREVVALSPAVKTLKATPGVEDVVVEENAEPARVASGALATIRAVAWAAAGLFGGLALLVVLAATRVRLDRSRKEREVAYLLGAEPSFFVLPTALAGALYAACAACLAGALVKLGIGMYGDDLAGSLATTVGAVELAFPAVADVAIFVGVAAALGLVGGALAGAGAAPQTTAARVRAKVAGVAPA